MAIEQRGFVLGVLVAAADLRALQFTFVKVDAAGKIAAAVTSGGKVLGVLQNKPNTGEVAEVMTEGVSKLVAGAAVTQGSNIMSDAAGKGIAAATAASTMTGICLESVANAGEIMSAYINPCVGVV